ncbi:hypothetical protein SUGI_1087160 [Cryptomeria japonica]|nr:hypothetical protein SUGI_1087160 [Cryptomeria japonica]
MDNDCMGVIENVNAGLERSEYSLLNTMKEKGKGIAGNERSHEESVWSECPDHIIERMFSTLLVEFSSRFRIVCKEWNVLLTSSRFLSLLPERDPWLLLCNETHVVAYCFLTQSWKTISLCFLPSPTTETLSQGYSRFCSKSGGGLLLIEIRQPQKMYMICNPLTGVYRDIPADIAEKITVMEIMDNGESYKIVGLPREENPSCIQIYHFFEMSWQIEDELSLPVKDFPIATIRCAKDLLICASGEMEFVIWNMESKQPKLVSFPEANLSFWGDVMNSWIDEVVVCGSTILFVVRYMEFGPDSIIVNFQAIVWELFWEEEKSIWSWKELTRMPSNMCRRFINLSYAGALEVHGVEDQFVGVGNFLCFATGQSNTELFVYSLPERSWSRIRFPPSLRFFQYHAAFSFQPKPGMKI